MQIIQKPWGHEVIFAHTDKYVGKILHINNGQALSLQYHVIKDETIYILSGKISFDYFLEGEPLKTQVLEKGDAFHITPLMRHRMTALEETDILEASTPELHDIVRLEDRYGRIK